MKDRTGLLAVLGERACLRRLKRFVSFEMHMEARYTDFFTHLNE